MSRLSRLRNPAGRGSLSNREGRFEPLTVEGIDDGWRRDPEDPDKGSPTELIRDLSRTVLSRNDSPDVPFDQSVNPYRGCEHGCVYCYARPSHAWLGMSPGLDFESRILFKPEAARLLAAELDRKTYRCRVLVLGSNTDPYQPVERRLGVTRSILELLSACRHPVSIVTKGALIERDLDVLGEMAGQGLVSVMISVTTLDPALKRIMEPRAASPASRLEIIRALSAAGVPTGVLVAPVIPAINDHELEAILAAAAESGADRAAHILLRLPGEVAGLFREWLERYWPDRAGKVMSILRQARGGRDNDPRFGSRMTGLGPWAGLLDQRVARACRTLGLARGELRELETSLFRPPSSHGKQMSLL